MAGQDVLWQANLDYCDSLSLGNRKWRVPNINELNSIVLPESTIGFSTSTFPNPITEATATSTTLPSNTASYASITFDDVSLVNFDKASGLAFVRCVSDF